MVVKRIAKRIRDPDIGSMDLCAVVRKEDLDHLILGTLP